jgi:hypothetical protein
VQCLVARFSVLKVTELPAARRGVLFGVLDHKLNIYGGPGDCLVPSRRISFRSNPHGGEAVVNTYP